RQSSNRRINQHQIGGYFALGEIKTGKQQYCTKQLRRSFDFPRAGEGFKFSRCFFQVFREGLKYFCKNAICIRRWNDHDENPCLLDLTTIFRQIIFPPFSISKSKKGFILKLAQMRERGRQSIIVELNGSNPCRSVTSAPIRGA